MALLSRARAIAQAIERDKCCAYCLLDFSRDLATRPEELDRLRRDCHELWDACIRAVTVPEHGDPAHESASFLRSLEAAATRCTAHSDSSEFESYLIKAFIDAACDCVRVCLSVGPRSAVKRAEKKHKAFSNKRGAWPMRQEDIFPSGVDGEGRLIDVRKIRAWSLYVETPNPAFLLADLLHIAHPLVFPVLVEDRKDLVLAVSSWICNPTAGRMLFGNEPRNRDAFYLRERKTAAAVALLRSMRDAPDAAPDALLQFTLEYEDLLFRSANLGLKVLNARHAPDAELVREVAALAAAVHTRLPQPDSLLSSEAHALLPQIAKLDIAGVLHVLVRTLAAQRRICAGPDCGTSVYATGDPDAAFRACARCVLVRYCSPACQRAHWKAGHKRACATFCNILSRASVDMDRDDFRRSVAPLTESPEAEHELSTLAATHSRVLPTDVVLRVGEIVRIRESTTVVLPDRANTSPLHRDAAVLTGRPDFLAGASGSMNAVANILRRQERWASGA